MSEVIVAALITGGLGLLGIILTRFGERADKRETARLQAELSEARAALEQLQEEAERYKAAYLGLIEVTQGLLGEFEVS